MLKCKMKHPTHAPTIAQTLCISFFFFETLKSVRILTVKWRKLHAHNGMLFRFSIDRSISNFHIKILKVHTAEENRKKAQSKMLFVACSALSKFGWYLLQFAHRSDYQCNATAYERCRDTEYSNSQIQWHNSIKIDWKWSAAPCCEWKRGPI